MNILVINPGSTSTKFAVYQDEQPLFCHVLEHSVEELSQFPNIDDQMPLRSELILHNLEHNNLNLRFDAIISRGGMVHPIESGVYAINDKMLHDIRHTTRKHACNLGCAIARQLAERFHVEQVLTADPCIVDELCEEARITGMPELPHTSIWHALNQKATARRYAEEHHLRYEDLNLIVCHIGGGISVAAHQHGRAIDTNNGLDGDGPMSPERAGTLPVGDLIKLCYSGKFALDDLKKRIVGRGGQVAHLGTSNLRLIEQRIHHGDEQARVVVEAMVLQISKAILGMTGALCQRPDAILLTGGCTYSPYLVERLRRRIEFMAPVAVYPGENEMDSLAYNALEVLRGHLKVKTYA